MKTTDVKIVFRLLQGRMKKSSWEREQRRTNPLPVSSGYAPGRLKVLDTLFLFCKLVDWMLHLAVRVQLQMPRTVSGLAGRAHRHLKQGDRNSVDSCIYIPLTEEDRAKFDLKE